MLKILPKILPPLAFAALLAAPPALAQVGPCNEPNAILRVRNTAIGVNEYVVFKFKKPPTMPNVSVIAARPPFTQDGSGEPVTVGGALFTQVTFRGVVWTCKIAEEFHLPRAGIKDIKSIGQFEGIITYVIGRRATWHYRATYSYDSPGGVRSIVVKYRK
jgi:hypothetical protein